MEHAPGMHDERWEPGMPALARQAPARRDDRRPPQRVPEPRPTPLQPAFIYLSVVALVCGTLAISAWELGQPLAAPIVRYPVLIAAVLLLLVTADATVRIWRSARAWQPIAPGRAAFRLVWVGVLLLGLALEAGAAWLVLAA